jgi:hypothetical protein
MRIHNFRNRCKAFQAHLWEILRKPPPIREILYSQSALKREIASQMSQRIAKFQTDIWGANGRFQANIWRDFGNRKSNISLDSAGLNETPYPGRKKCAASHPSPEKSAGWGADSP